MSSSTEGRYIGELVKLEGKLHFSREELLVDASQTLVFGEVCQKGEGGRMKALATAVDEVQSMAITGTVNAGTYRLKIPLPDGGFEYTPEIAYDDDIAAINAHIAETALGASQLIMSGTIITAMVFTFSGAAVAGVGFPLIDVDLDSLTTAEDSIILRTTAGGTGVAAVDEVQTATTTLTPDGGTFTLSVPHYNGTTVTTAAIAWDASAATIEAAIDTAFALVTPVPEDGSISVAGTKIGDDDIVLTYDGEAYEGRDWPLATVDAALLLDDAVVCSSTFAETTKGSPATSGEVAGVLIAVDGITTAGGVLTTKGLFIVRDAILSEDRMTFGSGNKVDTIVSLANLGVVVRSEAEITETQTT